MSEGQGDAVSTSGVEPVAMGRRGRGSFWGDCSALVSRGNKGKFVLLVKRGTRETDTNKDESGGGALKGPENNSCTKPLFCPTFTTMEAGVVMSKHEVPCFTSVRQRLVWINSNKETLLPIHKILVLEPWITGSPSRCIECEPSSIKNKQWARCCWGSETTSHSSQPDWEPSGV